MFCGPGRGFEFEGIFAKFITYEEVLFVMECEEISGKVLPSAIWDIFREYELCCLHCFVMGADDASFYVVGYVCIYARPVYSRFSY